MATPTELLKDELAREINFRERVNYRIREEEDAAARRNNAARLTDATHPTDAARPTDATYPTDTDRPTKAARRNSIVRPTNAARRTEEGTAGNDEISLNDGDEIVEPPVDVADDATTDPNIASNGKYFTQRYEIKFIPANPSLTWLLLTPFIISQRSIDSLDKR
eukprot:CAMPEP_0202451338 /NCGR_PEP_ID=MMETSP1360-20130828/9799_1 /ASSEMBLY_ACC=CAM_ASM_000848 /TAXON_ID=515479 /ORGANISM="Licmophora paradoxa, Strain CCMP2313" /LENGTH=163 /DNA_ID=CAMNT_0049069893 /DNA_START=103 /DNA_END=594 /DNA_ORIENTATION=-